MWMWLYRFINRLPLFSEHCVHSPPSPFLFQWITSRFLHHPFWTLLSNLFLKIATFGASLSDPWCRVNIRYGFLFFYNIDQFQNIHSWSIPEYSLIVDSKIFTPGPFQTIHPQWWLDESLADSLDKWQESSLQTFQTLHQNFSQRWQPNQCFTISHKTLKYSN